MMEEDNELQFGSSSSPSGTILGYQVRRNEDGMSSRQRVGGGSERSHPLGQELTLVPTVGGEPRSFDAESAARRYDVVKFLGEGAMGVVSLVRDNDISRNVAVKQLNADLRRSDTLGRFVEEVRILGQLEHPNIMPIHDVGVDEQGRPYFIMKYVDGDTLDVIIERLRARDPAFTRTYTIERRIEVMIGVLRALEFAHSRGILHRDVKPENIMVGAYGEVTLMDWGIAHQMGRATEEDGEVIGTPLYMSSEQARGENSSLDARSDLFSATVVFHEFLTLNHYLPPQRDILSIVKAVATRGWKDSLMAWHRSVQSPMPPMELYHFVRRGLQLDREKRYASASDMISRLQGLLEGRIPVQCHITLVKSAVRRTGRFVDRHPWLSFLIFAGAATSSGVGLLNLLI